MYMMTYSSFKAYYENNPIGDIREKFVEFANNRFDL